MSDYALLEASLNKNNRELLTKHLRSHTIQPMTKGLLRSIEKYCAEVGHDTILRESFFGWFNTVEHATSPEKKLEPFKLAFAKWDRLADEGVLDVDVRLLVSKYMDLDVYTRILDVATKGAEGDPDTTPADIVNILDEYHTVSVDDDDREALDPFEVTTDITEFPDDVLSRGLEWPLEELNISCGPVRQGNLIEVGAYTETGKTTFVSHVITYMSKQLEEDDYVVWVNNEEAWTSVVSRLYQSALGKSGRDIDEDPEKHKELYNEAMGRHNRVRFLDSSIISADDIDRFCKRVKPKIIVIDMLDKVKGFSDAKRDDLRLQALYSQARDWAKLYGPVFLTSQATGDAAYQQWVRMDQLAGSKVAKQAEADVIITIGRTEIPGDENMRYLNIPKNKLHGGDRSLESERHGKWAVSINGEIGRYKGMDI